MSFTAMSGGMKEGLFGGGEDDEGREESSAPERSRSKLEGGGGRVADYALLGQEPRSHREGP